MAIHKKTKKNQKTKSTTKSPDVVALQEELFILLDNAKLVPVTILNSQKHKEHYETLAMFAFRKLEAARYHAAQVDRLYETHRLESRRVLRRAKKPKSGSKISSISTQYRRPANEFMYELAAFFAAVRSGIDFLARLCIEHTKQMHGVESISKFLAMAKEGRSGATVDVIAKHAVWLMHLRDYRDHLVHFLTITAPIGAGRVWKYGKWKSSLLPVMVPTENPKFVADTRMRRLMEDEDNLPGFSVSTMEMWAAGPNGELIDGKHSVAYLPGIGFERIELQMKHELKMFEAFYSDVLKTLIDLDFAPVEIGPKKKPKHNSLK